MSSLAPYLRHLETRSSLDVIVLGLVSCVLFAVLSQAATALRRQARKLGERGAETVLAGLERVHPVTFTGTLLLSASAALTFLPLLVIAWSARFLRLAAGQRDWEGVGAALLADAASLWMAALSLRDIYGWLSGRYVGSRKGHYDGHRLKPDLQQAVDEWRRKDD